MSATPKKTTPTGTRLRRAILDEARKSLMEGGYGNLSLRPIAKEVGISPTAIYVHFRNKDALLHALIDEGMNWLYQSLRARTAGASSREEGLARMCRGYIEFGLENAEYYEVMFLLRPERMQRFPASKYRRARRNLDLGAELLLGAVQADGPRPEPSPAVRTAVTLAWATLHGVTTLLNSRRIDVRLDREALIDDAIERTTSGLIAALPTS